MNTSYNPAELEQDMQATWKADNRFQANESFCSNGGEKFYCLSMLPYPSGELHMGHVRNYTIGDVIARFQWQQGNDVLHPMGWDAFGLPAENAAIKHQLSPHNWTQKNIKKMRKQLQALGYSFDWSREIATCEPDYYRWEQWLFTKMFAKGLAYKKESLVNWDPVDKTVLANEQVVDGCGWRSGAPVEQKRISQWFLRITDYADELLQGLDQLTGWPEQVQHQQRNWIGRSSGVNIHFPLQGCEDSLSVYTTRVDTLMGVPFLAIAADHPLLANTSKPELKEFIDSCKKVSVAEADLAKQEKHGMDTGIVAIHPLTQQPLPVWVTNYVIMGTGTGAVMAVPAHDQRDFEFASKYKLPILPVIAPINDEHEWDYSKAAFTEPGRLINSSDFNDLICDVAKTKITEALAKISAGEEAVNYRLRDWGISRQRYWGAPIPIIYCDDCGAVAVPEQDLPVVLPTDVVPSGSGSPLKDIEEFYHTTCPNCQKPAVRETDTMDTFVESSWYYARYCCADQHETMLDDRAKYWTPVDQYVGGVEHAVMHLLYARFMHKVLRDFGLLNSDEPFTNLLTQGMVLKDGHKMSKSKGNVVAPQPLIKKYGADTVRLFTMFAAPPQQDLEWSDTGVEGAYRFMRRLWQLAHQIQPRLDGQTTRIVQGELGSECKKLRRETHILLRQAHFDMQRLQYNTVVSAAMKLCNSITKACESSTCSAPVLAESMQILLLMLNPITPHVTEHLWQLLQFPGQVHRTPWPQPDAQATTLDAIQYVVQVNGKLRAKLEVAADADEDSIKEQALAADSLAPYLSDKSVKRVIVVPKKLVNIVVV